jgi:hypothetical protein
MTFFKLVLLLVVSCTPTVLGFAPAGLIRTPTRQQQQQQQRLIVRYDYVENGGGQPSDYDTSDLPPDEKEVMVDDNEEDALIRDALKRELLVLASVTNRGEYASKDERDIVIDLIAQLEALNPTAEPASQCEGDWDLCLSSTQFFRSSPFFQAIRVAVGEDQKQLAENGFDLHDRATSGSRVGRVRQSITSDRLISEVDLEVGLVPGIPIRLKGTVVTAATLRVVSDRKWELQCETTKVKGSNIPIFNDILEDQLNVELPVGDFYNTVQGANPVIPMTVRSSETLFFVVSMAAFAIYFVWFVCLFVVHVLTFHVSLTLSFSNGSRLFTSMRVCASPGILTITFSYLREHKIWRKINNRTDLE